jgi:hypothetical protein
MNWIKLWAVAGVVSAVAIGCGQKESPPPAPTAAPPTSAPDTATAVKQTVEKTVAEVQKVAESTQQAVQKTVSEAAGQAQALIDQARAWVSEKKYADALGAVDKLAGLSLTPEQQTLVQGVKAELGKLGADIEKGIANLKAVVAQKDYTQGLNLVKQLADYQLTPEQQKVVDGLKAELQKALGTKGADEAKKALGNVLGGDK